MVFFLYFTYLILVLIMKQIKFNINYKTNFQIFSILINYSELFDE